MSNRLKVSLTVFGPLLLILSAMLDARLTATLAATAVVFFGIWIVVDRDHQHHRGVPKRAGRR
jgi:hypothetical protein